MKLKGIIPVLLLAALLFGCTQPASPSATPTGSAPYVKAISAKLSLEIPTEWKRSGTSGGDIVFTDQAAKTTLLMGSMPMEGKTLRDFAAQQLGIMEDRLTLTEMAVAPIKNGETFNSGGRDWLSACYSFADESGKEIGQCAAITQCGSEAGTIVLSAEKGELAKQILPFMHSLETFKC